IINSSDPEKVGKRHDVTKMTKGLKASRGGRGVGSAKPYELMVPVIVGDEQLGYVQVNLLLDNISDIQRANFLRRLLATLLVFVIGTTLVFYLARRYTEPIHRLVAGVKKVSSGDLSVTFPTGGLDEIGELSATFNEMVVKLREREHLEKRLYEAEHLSKVGQLASGIAHEIRNPLNYISLAVDHLKTEIGQACGRREDLTELLDKIKEEVRRVNYMVINFMNYGRPLKLRPAPVSYGELVGRVLPILAEKLGEQRIRVETEIPGDLPRMQADPELLRNCLFNFLINAGDAMPDGGVVTLGASYDTESGMFALTFRDHGKGIEPEDLPRIFQPYFTTKEAGIGLGLAITERIIREHGGSISVESTPGQGTVFTVSLPQRPPAAGLTTHERRQQ
ncbi:MAG TPA: ATP-binding protein, partial [Verrucomicrobiae bacterium]|nr:ATP-binding protein [Verrucomicrobiae bacterium]